jgi:hypothetical protein
MQPINRVNETVEQLIKLEHYRWHCAEHWPDSPYKEAALAAVHSALERLEAVTGEPYESPACMICASRDGQAKVLMFPSRPKRVPDVVKPAA